MASELENMFSSTMEGLRSMIDVNTIVGAPIETPDGTVIIPVSKVAFGFGMGGWDQNATIEANQIAGGSGGGVTVTPVGFLIVSGGNVKMLGVDASSPFEKIVETVPDLIKSIGAMFGDANK